MASDAFKSGRRAAADALLDALPSWGREAIRWGFAAVAFHVLLARNDRPDIIGLGNAAAEAADELMSGLEFDLESFDPDAPVPFVPTEKAKEATA